MGCQVEPIHADVSGHAVNAELAPYATVKCSDPVPVAGAFTDEKSNQYQLVSEDVTIR